MSKEEKKEMVCLDCDHVFFGQICPKCKSKNIEDLETAQENFNYAEFQGDVDYDPLPLSPNIGDDHDC